MKRNILITGGAKGIGRGIVKELVSSGHNVLFTYNSSSMDASALKAELEIHNSQVYYFKIDLANPDKISGLLEYFHKVIGGVDVLINNAALAQEKPFLEITTSDYEKVLTVNLQTPFILSQMLIPYMQIQKWGRIINISSIGGQWGGINQIHYAVSKAGLINLTRSIAKTFGKDQITCNCIAPGLIKTDMIEQELNSDAGRKKIEMIPTGRLGTIEEVAATIGFLITDQAAYINGQTINLNGGLFFN